MNTFLCIVVYSGQQVCTTNNLADKIPYIYMHYDETPLHETVAILDRPLKYKERFKTFAKEEPHTPAGDSRS